MSYNQVYFAKQRQIGVFGGTANLYKFAPYIKRRDAVLDFGCGGGFLLQQINTRIKLGVDINPVARQIARQNGVKVYASLRQIPGKSVDVIISNHALEHVPNPLQTLVNLRRVLKHKGIMVCVVPHEKLGKPYTSSDPNQHLYTWHEQTLGNLFHTAGFKVLKIKVLAHQWPRYYHQIQQLVGWQIFHLICRIWAQITGERQLLIVAQNL